MSVAIRSAVAEDWPKLRQLFMEVRRDAYPWLEPEKIRSEDLDEQTQGELLLIAEDDSGLPAGFVSVWEPDNFIHHLYVGLDRQRLGVGRALLHALPEWPTARYRLKCLTRNLSALSFYRACNFIEVGSGISEDGDYILLESRGGPPGDLESDARHRQA
ncbi:MULTISPECIES: GNAT family N-acetyltransferase [Burkholderia]|uniref:GNAT family acetyltransferase n=1 Tax=Burkholderia paludis TaxID=1506587 RepID=A0A6J5F6G8_9BURK|nr:MULTISPECIES: GNAT family N-acetyltransferase [Burkholderia]CAB3773963.1 hypothetical protein LMG30113_07377 [Burkholderia paludis]VWC47754.1 GNAT family acetyltransferase [Burkholderia paludis]